MSNDIVNNSIQSDDEYSWSEEKIAYCNKIVSGIELPIVDKARLIINDDGYWE